MNCEKGAFMAGEPTKGRVKKILSTCLNILMYAFFAVCVVALLFSVAAKKDADGTVTLFGMQMRLVISPSMEACDETDVSEYEIGHIPVKSMVFVKTVPQNPQEADAWYASLKKGDVLTFKYVYVSQETITHRITHIAAKDTGGYIIQLEGDNKNADASTLQQTIDTSEISSPNYVIGRVVGQSYPLGLLLSIMQTPVGIICTIIIPCIVIMIMEILRLIGVFTEKRRRLALQKEEAQQREMEELRRQLEQLRNQYQAQEQMPSDAASDDTDE